MTRACGDCQLCCKLLPVREVPKLANTRCQHQRVGKGCMVYHGPRMPISCKLWNCRWLTGDDSADLKRPDRSHYVVDIMPDFVVVREDGVEDRTIPVLQVWVDPAYPEAWRDPRLMEYIARRGEEEGMAALIRFGSEKAINVFPPALTGADWHIRTDGQMHDKTHTPDDFEKAGYRMSFR